MTALAAQARPTIEAQASEMISALQDAQETLRARYGGGMATMPPFVQRLYQRREEELRELRATAHALAPHALR